MTLSSHKTCLPSGFIHTSTICQTAWEMDSLISRFWEFLICLSLRGLCDSGMWLRSSCSVIERGLCRMSDVSDTEAEQSWRSLIIYLFNRTGFHLISVTNVHFLLTDSGGPSDWAKYFSQLLCWSKVQFWIRFSCFSFSHMFVSCAINPHIIRITCFTQAPTNVTSSWFQWRLWFKTILFHSLSVLSQS